MNTGVDRAAELTDRVPMGWARRVAARTPESRDRTVDALRAMAIIADRPGEISHQHNGRSTERLLCIRTSSRVALVAHGERNRIMADRPEASSVRVQAAAARTSAAGSARFSFGLHHGAPALEERDRLGEGVVDFAARLARASRVLLPGHMQENMPNVPEALTRPREVIYDGATELMRSGDSWVVFGRADRDGPRGHDDPLWPLDALFGASDDIVEMGTDLAGDISTTHYRLTVDLAAADEFLPAGIGMPEGPFRRLRQLPTEVWLDSAGLARRIGIQNAAGNRQVWKVLEFWDFGVPVTITPPDPGQITTPDLTDLQRVFMEDD
jgi:hypothetical protein